MKRHPVARVLPTVPILAALLTVHACQRSKDLPLEAGFGGESVVGSLHEIVLSPTEIRQIRPSINFGLGYYLFVGRYQGLETRTFMLFDALPESAYVHRAELRFRMPARYGSGEVRVRAYAVVGEWKEKEVTWENAPQVDFSRVLGDTVWSTRDSLAVVMRLDTAAVTDWTWNASANRGFVLQAEGGEEVLFRLYAIDVANLNVAPTLWLKYTKGGKLDSAETYPSADVFVAHRDDLPTEVAYTLTGQDVDRILLKFDLSRVPRGASINRAQLEWSVVPEQTRFEDPTLSIGVHRVTEWPWEGEYVSFDSSGYRAFATLTPSDRLFQLTAQDQIQWFSQVVQLMVAGYLPDYGFLLRIASEDAAVGRVAFVPSGSESASGPRLIITYTVPPGTTP
ncbi:MAG: DNRLRE domain-containing protein [candidate division KSB1 bacterium]|nr:DNRLRE domain-containing protein [candidate division KSB1 bacterium]